MVMSPIALKVLGHSLEGLFLFAPQFLETAHRQQQFIEDLNEIFDKQKMDRILKIFNTHLENVKSEYPPYEPLTMPFKLTGTPGGQFHSIMKQLDHFHYTILSMCYAYNELWLRKDELLRPGFNQFLLEKETEYIFDCFSEFVQYPGFPDIEEEDINEIVKEVKQKLKIKNISNPERTDLNNLLEAVDETLRTRNIKTQDES